MVMAKKVDGIAVTRNWRGRTLAAVKFFVGVHIRKLKSGLPLTVLTLTVTHTLTQTHSLTLTLTVTLTHAVLALPLILSLTITLYVWALQNIFPYPCAYHRAIAPETKTKENVLVLAVRHGAGCDSRLFSYPYLLLGGGVGQASLDLERASLPGPCLRPYLYPLPHP